MNTTLHAATYSKNIFEIYASRTEFYIPIEVKLIITFQAYTIRLQKSEYNSISNSKYLHKKYETSVYVRVRIIK